MKVAICVRAIQLDGSSHAATWMGETIRAGGHAVSILSPHPPKTVLPEGLTFISIGQRRWESEAAHVRRLGHFFDQERFDVLFVMAGMETPQLAQACAWIPDSTAVVPVVLGDRDHAYDFVSRTSSLWNLTLAISPRLRDETARRIPGRPVRMLTLAIELPREAELPARIPHSDPLKLIYVGRLFGRKNVLLLPKILSACMGRGIRCTLTVVGNGPDRDPLEQACRDLGVLPLVEFASAPTQADLYRALRRHHVSLFTSGLGEGLGLVLLEAQANGCVPVASRIPGVTDFAIEDGVTGLLAEIGNPEDFADRIATLTDPERWQNLSAAATARTRARFDVATMARELECLLRELGEGQWPLPSSRRNQPRAVGTFRSRIPRALLRFLNWSGLPNGRRETS